MNTFVNEIRVAGKVINTPEFYSGKENCLKFSLMTKKKVTGKEGETFEPATFHNIVVFGDLANEFQGKIQKSDWISAKGEFTKRKHNGHYYDQIEALELLIE